MVRRGQGGRNHAASEMEVSRSTRTLQTKRQSKALLRRLTSQEFGRTADDSITAYQNIPSGSPMSPTNSPRSGRTSILRGATTPGTGDLQPARKAFARADVARRGTITLHQLAQLLVKEEIIDKPLTNEQLAAFDVNADGAIGLQDFLILWMELEFRMEQQKSKLLIEMFPDPPGRGFAAKHPLPCYDESDNGVPHCCRGDKPACWKILNHAHPLTNKNIACAVWGNIGFKYFDQRRHRFMALRWSS